MNNTIVLKIFLWTSVLVCLGAYFMQAVFGTAALNIFIDVFQVVDQDAVLQAKLIEFSIHMVFTTPLCCAMCCKQILYINILVFIVLFFYQCYTTFAGFGDVDGFDSLEKSPNHCGFIKDFGEAINVNVEGQLRQCRGAVAIGFFILILQVVNIVLSVLILRAKPESANVIAVAQAVPIDVEAK